MEENAPLMTHLLAAKHAHICVIFSPGAHVSDPEGDDMEVPSRA